MIKVKHLAKNLRTITGISPLLLTGFYAHSSESPLAPIHQGISHIHLQLTDKDGGQCLPDFIQAKAGPITFTIKNLSATSINEIELLSDNRILGEKENLAPGLPAVSFTLTLNSGDYQIYCPGAHQETVPLKVSGENKTRTGGSIAELLNQGTEGYQHYVTSVAENMLVAVRKLQQIIDRGDLTAAKIAYAQARPFYEHIESDVEGFLLAGHKATDNAGNLDYLIDMRASNVDPAVGWHGFHAIERDLFQKQHISSKTRQLAKQLTEHVTLLSALASQLKFNPEDLANGAASLLEEVQNSKINGEEEAYSHLDLLDFSANIEGAEQAFAFLKPGMKKIDPQLTLQIEEQFAHVKSVLNQYRDNHNPGGFQYYTPQLKNQAGPVLSRAVQSLQEPLARIAAKVAAGGAQ